MARSIDLGDDVNTTLEDREVNNPKWRSKMEKFVHLVSILDNICDLRRSVDLFG